MVRKCRAAAEIAVMEVDVRRTARPPPDFDDVPPAATNKRKITAGTDFHFSTTTTTTTSFVKLRSRRRRLVSQADNWFSTNPISDDDYASSACCCSSKNGCSEVVVDLEDEKKDEHGVAYKSSRERETTPSNDMESPAGKSEATSGSRSLSSSAKMPAESELEEFFIAAEKNIRKRFAEMYNYDIVEDVPLEGRYKWIRLKP